ncbi:MAG: DUF4437 domain-containing protein [Verrucomicrobiota bacterium]
MKRHIPLVAATLAATAVIAQVATEKSDSKDRSVVRTSDVPWGALNPARGDKGPRACALWNDRAAKDASGFLVRFADGFSSPPHIHNVTYRGVVISGLIHNDDPEAAEMWMPAGSFWTQPAGEVHITSAKGQDAMAYIEIDSGPYLVHPKEDAFDNGERPVSVVPSNLVWLSRSQTGWIADGGEDQGGTSPEIAFLWGTPDSGSKSGSFLRLPEEYKGELKSNSGSLRVIVVKGQVNYSEPTSDDSETLVPGEYFTVPEKKGIRIISGAKGPSVAYIQAAGSYLVTALK